jgi:uncharacterized protein
MPTASPTNSSDRIDIIDALRGSALLGILLLHAMGHFDFARYPQNPPEWLRTLNLQTRDTVNLLFHSKSYAVFALLFGFSFFVILDRAERRGVDFRWRFLWRLGVLAIIGYVHSLIYCGDILIIIAVLGLPLAFLYRANTRVLAVLAILLALQLPALWQVGRILFDSGYVAPPFRPGRYYGDLFEVYANGGFLDMLRLNAWTAHRAGYWWWFETGRWLQMPALFIAGLLLGRSRVFENPERYSRLARRLIGPAVIAFAASYYAQNHLAAWGWTDNPLRLARNLLSIYGNLAEMLVWVSGFVLLYHYTRVRGALRLLIPYGRMSLTCYVTGGIVGVLVFYNFGFGMFRHWGPFYSVLYGAGFFAVHLAAAHGWMKRFRYGPLEWLWRCTTLMTFKIPLRKRENKPFAAAQPLVARGSEAVGT